MQVRIGFSDLSPGVRGRCLVHCKGHRKIGQFPGVIELDGGIPHGLCFRSTPVWPMVTVKGIGPDTENFFHVVVVRFEVSPLHGPRQRVSLAILSDEPLLGLKSWATPPARMPTDSIF